MPNRHWDVICFRAWCAHSLKVDPMVWWSKLFIWWNPMVGACPQNLLDIMSFLWVMPLFYQLFVCSPMLDSYDFQIWKTFDEFHPIISIKHKLLNCGRQFYRMTRGNTNFIEWHVETIPVLMLQDPTLPVSHFPPWILLLLFVLLFIPNCLCFSL